MDRKELLQEVMSCYKEQVEATEQFRIRALKYAKKQNAIDIERNHLLNSGVITGRNAETREAEIRTALVKEYDELLELEVSRDLAFIRKELADINVARARTILRVYELSQEVFDHEEI